MLEKTKREIKNRLDNPETQAILDTTHGMMSNKTKKHNTENCKN